MTDVVLAYVGVDWAAETHYAYALDARGSKLGHRSFAHSGDGLAELSHWIRTATGAEPQQIAIGIEVPHGPVVESLMDAGFQVHAVNPKQLDRFRDRFTMAGAKDDRLDAYVLAGALRTNSRLYRHLEPMHPTIIELREWSRMTEDLSVERNRLANRFRHQLWRYYPQVLDLAQDWSSPWVLDLWELIPTPDKAKRTRSATVTKLLYQSRVRKWTSETVLAHLQRTPITVAPGVTEACVAHCRVILARLRLVLEQIKIAMKNWSGCVRPWPIFLTSRMPSPELIVIRTSCGHCQEWARSSWRRFCRRVMMRLSDAMPKPCVRWQASCR